MEAFVAFTIITTTAWKLVSLVKYLKAGDQSGVFTQLLSYAVGIALGFLFKASDFAATFKLEGLSLAELNTASVIIFGLGIGSAASAAYDSFSKNPEPKLMGPGE